MEKRVSKILGIILVTAGIILVLNSMSGITGFVIFKDISKTIGSILGLAFISVSVILLIGTKTLEKILKKEGKDLNEILNAREDFVNNNHKSYKRYLESRNEIPKQYRTQTEKEDYARRELMNKFVPLVHYDETDSIEYLERFGESPRTDRIPVPGDKGIIFPIKINYRISDNLFIKFTEYSSENELLWNGARAKIYRLNKGNLGQLGKGYRYVPNTGNRFLYLKTRSGARVFLEKVSEHEYDLIGVVSGEQTKNDESRAINRCQELAKTPR